MPVVIVGLVGSAVIVAGSLYAASKILTRQRQAAIDDFEEMFEAQKARLGDTLAIFAEGVADAAEKAFH